MPLILDISQVKALKRKKRIKKLRPVKSPVLAEKLLRQKTEQLWERAILPSLDRIKRAIESGVKGAQLSNMIESELHQIEFMFDTDAETIVDMWRLAVDKITRVKLNAALNRSLGIDITVMLNDPVVAEAMIAGSFAAEELIKTMPNKIMGQVADAVMKNMHGVPLPEGRNLLDQIDFLGTRSRAWAMVIARDQTAKLTATINQARQKALGVEMYIWRTMRDKRVVGNPQGQYPDWNEKHHNHYIMEGLYCKFDDATVYSTDQGKTWKPRTTKMPKMHPGFEIMDRCYTEPIMDLEKILERARIQ